MNRFIRRYFWYTVWTTDGASALSVCVSVCLCVCVIISSDEGSVQYPPLCKISTLTNNHVIVLSGKLGESVGGILRDGLWFWGISHILKDSLTFWKIHLHNTTFSYISKSFHWLKYAELCEKSFSHSWKSFSLGFTQEDFFSTQYYSLKKIFGPAKKKRENSLRFKYGKNCYW